MLTNPELSATALLIGSFGGKINKAQKSWVEAVETRVATTTQILTSMKSIKMSGLSRYAANLMQSLRIAELDISLAMRRFLTVAVGLCMPLSASKFDILLTLEQHSRPQISPRSSVLRFILYMRRETAIHCQQPMLSPFSPFSAS